MAKSRSMNVPFRQPKTPKDIKFIKHGLDQMVVFIKMKPVILETLNEVGQGRSIVSASCRAYLRQLLQPSFDLILAFVVVKLLSSRSSKQNICLYTNILTLLKWSKNCFQTSNFPTSKQLYFSSKQLYFYFWHTTFQSKYIG